MAYIKVIEEEDAGTELKETYGRVKGERGKLSNILKIHSLLPKTIETHLNLYMSIMFDKSGLKREDRELIAVVVSAANDCEYCVNHHAEALLSYWKDEIKVAKAGKDFRSLELSAKQIAMLEFAEKLTKYPGDMEESDIEKLRLVEFNDEEILSISLVTNYFNFVNRNANALGVEFSKEEVKGYKY
jgi:uncharacterized peroxidase-related enzyme